VVDVEGLLGSKDPEKEKEWDEVLKEIEDEDELWAAAGEKKPRKGPGNETKAATATEREESSVFDAKSSKAKVKTTAPRGFY